MYPAAATADVDRDSGEGDPDRHSARAKQEGLRASCPPACCGSGDDLLWVRHFETIEELRQALLAVREVYNTTWLIERHGSISPAELRQKQLQPVARVA